jgi:hypothetical protein
MGIPFFSDHIRAVTGSFGSKLADAGIPYFGNLGSAFANQGQTEVTHR